jgi:putative phosphoesterase
MSVAFISDIHANFTALQAVLADIKSRKVDQLICLGDVATMGPQPKEVIAALRGMDSIFIKGNHDEAVLDPQNSIKYEIAPHLATDLLWCRDQLDKDELEFIQSFQATHQFKFPNEVEVLCFHGSPLSNTDLLLATTPPEVIEKYLAGQTATVFIGGHSHIQMHRRLGGQLILNSGSVGNAFQYAYTPGHIPSLLPWAEYAILDQAGSTLTVDLRRVYYDTDKLMEEVKKAAMPGAAWWLRQFKK